MISQDDIDAFSDDDAECLKTANEIVNKALNGTTRFRLIQANQEMAMVRAYLLMRDAADAAAAYIADHRKRQLDSISLSKPKD